MLSPLKWVGIIVLLILVVAGSSAFIFGLNQRHKAEMVQKTLDITQEQLKEANASLEKQAVISQISDEAVTTATVKTQQTTKKTQETVQKVDIITKQVANETITSATANAAYLNSMWDAYCEAKPSADKCATRQPTP